MPKVSVIVPVYNTGTYLNKCISSVLAQTFTDFEILLINDGSTDNSAEICESIAATDSRIVFYNKENGGLASARNFALDKIQTEFFCCVDSDDYIEPDFLEFALCEQQKTDCDILLCGLIMENGKKAQNITAEKATYNGTLGDALVDLKNKNLIDTACNKLYKTAFVKQSGIAFCEGEIFEDTDFNLRLLKYSPVITVSDRAFYHYVLHMGSITRKYNAEKLITIKKRALLLKEVGAGIQAYADYYYIKSVMSSFIDMFLSLSKAEIKAEIKKEINDKAFISAANGAFFAGKKAAVIIKAAKSLNVGRIYFTCKAFYILKYKMQKLFMLVRV